MADHSIEAVSPAEQATGSAYVYAAAIFAALGGLLFGYDTGVISGALLFIKQQFGLSVFRQELVVSVVLVGAAISALGGGRLADRIGRRATLLITAVIFVVGALLCAAAPTAALLIFGRVIVGIGIGLSSTAVPLYISEISPAKARGWQVSLFQLAITVGILAAYLVDYAFSGNQSWRWMLGLAVLPGLILGIGMLIMPETPRWLARRGRLDQARNVLQKIRGGNDIEVELQEIEATLDVAEAHTFAEGCGDVAGLLRSVRPDAVVVDSEDGQLARVLRLFERRHAFLRLSLDSREIDRERRASSRLAGHMDGSVMLLDDATSHGESQAGAVLFRGEKGIKNLCEIFLRDTHARINDFHSENFRG